MKKCLCVIALVMLLPIHPAAQDGDNWPSLSYLKSDYKSVRVVALVRIRESKIVNQIPGYDNWKIVAEVVEPFKGNFRRNQTIEYFHGAEAPSKKEFFAGEKIVFLLREWDQTKKAWHYSVLENSTLPPNADRLQKLRKIKSSVARK